VADEGALDPKEAERLIKGEDAARADYLKRFYNVDQELPTHYDLVVSTDKLSAEQATGLIVAAAQAVE
jgi:cytidylate kinase